MTFDQIWKSLCSKNDRLLDDDAKVEFAAINLKRLLRQVYEQGQHSVENDLAEMRRRRKDNLFGDLCWAFLS